MTEEIKHSESIIAVTHETLPNLRDQIAALREQSGKEDEALRKISSVRERAIALGEHEHAVNLFWEEYLVGKHLLMAAKAKDGIRTLPSKSKGMLRGLMLMRGSASAAQGYIDTFSVESLRPRSHRFLGEVAMIEAAGLKRGYGKAVEHFRKGVSLFEQMEDPVQRVNALELSGFLAEALILDGKVDEGSDIAIRTFNAYDQGDGQVLRERDYYTWAVWKSGAVTKAWSAFLRRDEMPQGPKGDELLRMLDATDSILTIPEGQTTWGDRNFDIRRAEVASIRTEIGRLS